MKHLKCLSRCFTLLAVLLSDVMCAVVAYNYRGLLCAGAHMGASAPANVAFFLAIPFAVGIAVCLIVSAVLRGKAEHA